MNFVLGSGPAGAAAALALAKRGAPVTMLDAGGELEPAIQDRVRSLSVRDPELWSATELDGLKGTLRFNSEGAPLKLLFGSDFPYRDVERLEPVRTSGVDAYRSFATGGLSTLWGGSILPYSDADLQGWPLQAEALSEHYASILQMTGLSAERDELESLFPLYVEPTENLRMNRQAQAMLARMRANARELQAQNIRFGKARLAIRSPGSGQGCANCGMCLYGCPYGLIYSSRETVAGLRKSQAEFTYLSGLVVRKLVERNGVVEIHSVTRDGNQPRVHEASRVYLATGTYSSTRILLESLGAHGTPVEFRQSEHFLLPMLLTESASGIARDRQHTLSQLFIELLDESVSRHKVHLQLYAYNDFYSRMARARLGPVYPLLSPLLEKAFERVALIKGYFHSDESSSIRATLPRTASQVPAFGLEAIPNPRARAVFKETKKALSRNWNRIGAIPLGLSGRLGMPGSGVHVGGSFPMRERPHGFQTDLDGRPDGFSRVHVVDSSVFPTIPAPTITLTAMANAHRIATKEFP